MTVPSIRRPAVAGYYYPENPDELRRQVDGFLQAVDASPAPAQAVVVPHGSVRHAGRIVGAALAQVAMPRRCIIMGPSHTGHWLPWSLMAQGAYRTPLGEVPIDEACAAALHTRCSFLTQDSSAQMGEHAIEVLLPFLQRRARAELAIVPLIASSEDVEECHRVAEALAQVVRMQEEPVLLLASTDLSHYEPLERAAVQDHSLIEAIQALETNRLLGLVRDQGIRMCGVGAAICVLEAAKILGADRGTLVAYGTSADAGGDPHSVIGYAGIIVK